jgi:hypothetical protein
MDIKTAGQIGARTALRAGLIGLVLAYVIFGGLIYTWDENLLKALLWIFDVKFWYHIVIGAVGLLTMACIFGQFAGIEILTKRKNESLTGVKYGFLTLITGTLIGSSVGFIKEGLGKHNGLFDYYVKPLYWVTMFGIVPVILVGLWFGRQMKKKGHST